MLCRDRPGRVFCVWTAVAFGLGIGPRVYAVRYGAVRVVRVYPEGCDDCEMTLTTPDPARLCVDGIASSFDLGAHNPSPLCPDGASSLSHRHTHVSRRSGTRAVRRPSRNSRQIRYRYTVGFAGSLVISLADHPPRALSTSQRSPLSASSCGHPRFTTITIPTFHRNRHRKTQFILATGSEPEPETQVHLRQPVHGPHVMSLVEHSMWLVF